MGERFKLADLQRGIAAAPDESDRLVPSYQLRSEQQSVDLTRHLGRGVVLRLVGPSACINCAALTPRLFAGGHCFDCANTLARCDTCVMNPARCHYHNGTCREPEWGETFCMQPHLVYVALSSGPKVGITRSGREQGRWRDQGAREALPVIAAPSRRAAGRVEAYLTRFVSDRTDWRSLVTGTVKAVDLFELRRQLQQQMPDFASLQRNTADQAALSPEEITGLHWLPQPRLMSLQHPVAAYSPAQRLALSEAQNVIGNLQGILGHYLLFSHGVFNLAAHRGMDIEIELGPRFDEPFAPADGQIALF